MLSSKGTSSGPWRARAGRSRASDTLRRVAVALATLTALALAPGGLAAAASSAPSNPPSGGVAAAPSPGPAKAASFAAPWMGSQLSPPDMSVGVEGVAPYQRGETVKAIPAIIARQLLPMHRIPRESIISEAYLRTVDSAQAELSLKEALYLALRSNPNVLAARLDPLASMAGVKMANGSLDPDLLATVDTTKNVTPATSPILVTHGFALTDKDYDWNFSLNKVLSASNGRISLIFDNNHLVTNNNFIRVTPSYTPTLSISLAQPILRNFGWQYAVIQVRLAESAQRRSQWNYGQQLFDLVRQVANDYWNAVLARDQLRVAREALRFNQDLVRVNTIALRVGTLAPIDLQEAQAAEATAEANVFSAQATLSDTLAVLREAVMFNPQNRFLPRNVNPTDQPNPAEKIALEEERAFESAVALSPSLAALREAIRSAAIEVRYMQNQLLPSVTLGAQFGVTSLAGNALCAPPFGGSAAVLPNCIIPPSTKPNGFRLPFGGSYATALNHMFGFAYYNYSFLISFEMPLDNAPMKAQLAQARVGYEQLRMQYRAALATAVSSVQIALANVTAGREQVRAAREATLYARQALHDEQVRFRVGMATTHDLLQFENEEVSAEGAQVQAEIALEQDKLALAYADGTLLRRFHVRFAVSPPPARPWYALF